MRRAFRLALGAMLALAAAATAGPAAAAPQTVREAHSHPGALFRIRVEPVMGTYFTYRVFLPDPDNLDSLIVERTDGYLGDEAYVDLGTGSCPALRARVAALATLAMPPLTLGGERGYEPAAPRPEIYEFDGFLRFPNGGEGEFRFISYDVRGRPTDAALDWMRGLVRAFDGCRPRGAQRD